MSQAPALPAAAVMSKKASLPSLWERTRVLTGLAFPISMAQGATLLMALIDLAMVGRLGDKAIAALGLSVFSTRLIQAPVIGLTSSVRGVVARRRGAGSKEQKCLPLNAGMVIALTMGLPLALAFYWAAPWFFKCIATDPAVIRIGTPVLGTLCIGIPAIGMLNAFNGYWTGIEKPRFYLLVIIFMTILNTVLNYALIFGHFGAPIMGATGSAISTTVSLYAGVAINCGILWMGADNDGFLTARPDQKLLKRILKLGLPVNIAQLFFASGYVLFMRMVGELGTAELAAANVLVRVTMLLEILSTSLGMASATVVCRTIGEGDPAGASRWGWTAGMIGVVGITLVGLPFVIFPDIFLAAFIKDPHTLSIAHLPFRLQAATIGLCSLMSILGYTLNGIGDGKRIMIVSLTTQWLLFLPAVWFVAPYLHRSFLELWLVQISYSVLATALITGIWIDGRWKTITI